MLYFNEIALDVYDTREELGKAAASEAAAYIRDLLKEKEYIRCIFAAAPSQNEFLNSFFAEPNVDFSRIDALHMDEYIGLPSSDPRSFRSFLEYYFRRVPLHTMNFLDGTNDLKRECDRYSKLLLQAPVDVVFMGIGENGHIAFNDPQVADFHDPYWIKAVDLDRASREQQVHDGCFDSIDNVPERALTLTIPALMMAGRHFCIVPSELKAKALQKTLTGPISESCPASILRTKQGVRMFADRASYSLVKHTEGYAR